MFAHKPDPAHDLITLAEQERLLRFAAFDADTAWNIGNLLRASAIQATLGSSKGCSMEIEVAGQVLFACTTLNADPTQANWIRRKRNTVHKLQRSSYAVGRALARDNTTLESAHGLAEVDFAAHGGGFPIRLNSSDEVMGSIVFSGLPQRDDHNLVIAALMEHLDISAPELA